MGAWGQCILSAGEDTHSGPVQKPKSETRHVFHSLGGFLNDLEPNLVSDPPVIPLVWQERGHARASCAVRLSSPICQMPGPTEVCSLSQANSSTSVTFLKKLTDTSSPTHSFYFSLETHSPAQNEWPEDITEPLFLPGSGPAQPPQTAGA